MIEYWLRGAKPTDHSTHRASQQANQDPTYQKGLEVTRKVLGEQHVRRALKSAAALDRDFQDFITQRACGSIWTRPGLDYPTRGLVTIAMWAALGREQELALALHIHAARTTGATLKQIREVLMQAAVFAGFPRPMRV